MLPSITLQNIGQFLNKNEIVKATVAQIYKDFDTHGIHLEIAANGDDTYHDLMKELSSQINTLLIKSPHKLFSILYQVDITEKEIANANLELKEYSYPQHLAHLIIVRELKKVLFREYYKSHS